MPQVDLETLVSASTGGNTDGKIKCETLAKSAATGKEEDLLEEDEDIAVEVVAPDFPPESFWLSKDAEFDWFDRNAFFERKESTKGLSISTNFYTAPAPTSNSNSQRFSKNLKSKAAIIGLPKTQKTNFIGCKRRPSNIQLFPKRSQSVGKSASGMAEPSSPKVSCIGRVRSKKGRRRPAEPLMKKDKPMVRSRSDDHEKGRKGFYSRVMSMFTGRRDRKTRRTKSEKRDLEESTAAAKEEPRRKSAVELRTCEVEPPVLGGMRKFASGRRAESWSTEDFDVALSESFMSGPTKRS